MSMVLSVNIAVPRTNPDLLDIQTGIDKQPVDHAVEVRAPGPKHGGLGSGLVGDFLGEHQHHGGDDQAVYAYAREDLDVWQAELERPLRSGVFGDNLTTQGLDVTNALIGERWRIGDDVVLEVAIPRIPCRTFAAWLEVRGWIKQFTRTAIPGAYLRVVHAGSVRAGDPIVVEHRPDHDVTIGTVFRAVTLEPDLLPRLVHIEELPEELRARARRRVPLELDTDRV